MLEIGDSLLSREVQEYLVLQNFIPVSSEIALPKLLEGYNYRFRWKDWDYYLQVIRQKISAIETNLFNITGIFVRKGINTHAF